MSEAVMELRDISKTYSPNTPRAVSVLRGVSLVLRPGEITALVAPSGSGKSTLLHIAGLLDQPDRGEISVKGTAVGGLSEKQRTGLRRQQIGFVYQFHHLLPEFSALENILLPQLANGIPAAQGHERARALLAQVGLLERAAHRPGELSGGEQQRVAFCRALANAPAVLLADEPTGNLDPGTSEQVFAALLGIVRETGLSALIATHNLALAARMDRVVKLESGQLCEVEPGVDPGVSVEK